MNEIASRQPQAQGFTAVTATTHDLNHWLTFAARARDQLRGLTLVAECDMDPLEIDTAAVSLGTYINNHTAGDIRQTLGRTSVGLALLMPKVGELHYQDDTFWENFWDHAGVSKGRRSANLQTAVGEAFLSGLREQRLEILESVGRKFVDNILFHAGIPHALLAKWFEMLHRGIRAVGPDPDDVLAWAIRSAESVKLYAIPKPITRMLLHGEGFAADLVERSLLLLQSATYGGQPTTEEANLPAAFIEAAKESLESENQPPIVTRRQQVPMIRLLAEDGTVVLVLPPMPDFPGRLTWTVAMDGEVVQVQAPRVWGGVGGYASANVQIDSPVREVGVTAPGLGETAVIDLFEEELPVMAFDRSGKRLNPAAGLPKEPVWLLHLTADDGMRVDGGLVVLDIGSPLGWPGWSLQLWDLSGATSLWYAGARLRLRGQARAQIVSEDDRILEWVTIEGHPVHAARPRVLLPAGSARRWTVRLQDLVTGQVVSSFTVEPGESEVDPMRELPVPALGAYMVRVLGLGSDTSRPVAIAEGIEVRCEPMFRVFNPKGELAPCTVKVRLDGSEPPAHERHLGPTDTSATAQLASNGKTWNAVATPPALATSVQRPGGIPQRWAHGPATLFREEIDGTRLLLRIDRGADPDLQLCKGETVIQVINATTVTAGRNVLYDLARTRDSLQRGQADRLVLGRIHGDPGVQVAFIRPAQLTSGVVLEAGRVRLIDPAPAQLEAVIWCTGRPWDPPVVRPVDPEGTVLQKSGELFSGRAVVLPRVFDDWAEPEPLPRFPRKRTVLTSPLDTTAASGLEWFAQPDPLWRQSLQAEQPDRLWAALLLDAVLLPQGVRMPELRAQLLAHGLRRRARLAAPALVPFALPAPEASAALLRTLVAAMPVVATTPPLDGEMSAAFGQDPVTAALVALPWLTRAPFDYPAAMEAARSALGISAIGFILSGNDIDRRHGGPRTAAAIPPGRGRLPLLSAAARDAAADETLARSPKALVMSATQLATDVLRVLVAQHYDEAAEAVRQRGLLIAETDLHAASLAWAIACRFGPRSKVFHDIVKKHVVWQKNAHAIAPQLAIDLVIAEIFASHAFPLASQALPPKETQ